jgi:ribose transport system substrate-binding protein
MQHAPKTLATQQRRAHPEVPRQRSFAADTSDTDLSAAISLDTAIGPDCILPAKQHMIAGKVRAREIVPMGERACRQMSKITIFAVAVAAVGSVVGASAPASADMAAAEKLLALHRSMPSFAPPGPAFDAKKCMAGKSMFVIPLASSNPFNVAIAKSMANSAKEVGFRLTIWENQAKLDQWVQGMANAASQGYTLIDLMGGIPPAALGPQIKEARAKGIRVTTTHLYDVTQPISDELDGSTQDNYSLAGQIMAAWAITHAGGKVNAIIIGSDEVLPTKPFVKAIEEYLDQNAPGNKHQYINVPFPEWGTKIQPSIQSALVADPSINYILPIYDNMATFVVPALRVTNKADTVKIVSFNGSPGMLDLLRQGGMEMNVGESLGWWGMAGVDADMRVACGLPTVTDPHTPLLIFDKDNVATAGNPANYDKGYGDVHVDGFLKLWGLK